MEKEKDFWKLAIDFSKTVLDPEAQQKFMDYCKTEEFTFNERLLFRHMLKEAISFPFVTGGLKQQIEEDTKLTNQFIFDNGTIVGELPYEIGDYKGMVKRVCFYDHQHFKINYSYTGSGSFFGKDKITVLKPEEKAIILTDKKELDDFKEKVQIYQLNAKYLL